MVKGERKQNESLNTMAVKTALEETHYPCHVTYQCGIREVKMADELCGLIRGIFYASFI